MQENVHTSLYIYTNWISILIVGGLSFKISCPALKMNTFKILTLLILLKVAAGQMEAGVARQSTAVQTEAEDAGQTNTGVSEQSTACHAEAGAAGLMKAGVGGRAG